MAVDDSDQTGSTPRPDPTVLTTQALFREIAHLRELLESQIAAHGRLDAQRFENIEQRFVDRDLLTSQAFENVSEATAAALAASKEAVDKSEKAMKEQLAAITSQMDTKVGANAAQISDIKERLGGSEVRGTTTTTLVAIGISMAAVVTAIISVVLTVTSQ